MIRILGIDPGAEHVGISVWEVEGSSISLWDSWETTPLKAAQWWFDEGTLDCFGEVYAENYVPQGGFGNAGTGMDTLKLLGLLEWTYKLTTTRDVTLVTRADRDAALRRLKACGWDFDAGSDHAKDAQAVVVAGKRWKMSDLGLSARA